MQLGSETMQVEAEAAPAEPEASPAQSEADVPAQPEEIAEPMEPEVSSEPVKEKRKRAPPTVIKTSDYTGVHWSNSMNKWQAQRTVKGKTYNGGYYDNEKDAALRSDELVNLHGGESTRAKRNFTEKGERVPAVAPVRMIVRRKKK